LQLNQKVRFWGHQLIIATLNRGRFLLEKLVLLIFNAFAAK